ncbi:MAG: radical SAM protein [Planctomycetes bacterium]|nr:radical SAM protein [Planctomycetota bacterium]
MSGDKLKINEIFSSIQGESSWSGQACTFVRLQGCPLRCHYCDTSYAFREGSAFSFDEIIDKVKELNIPLVQITGGEPLAQEAVYSFIRQLCDLDYTVLIETSGVCSLSNCDPRSHKIVDIKTPNSGAENSFKESNYDCLSINDEVKFVITNREDFDWSVQIVEDRSLVEKVHAIHFSPVMFQESNNEIQGCEALDTKLLSKWIIADAPWARLQLQIHKYIWPATTRGV